MSYFVYRALTPDLKRIRLIHLQPKSAAYEASQSRHVSDEQDDSSSISVACTISHVSLNSAPPYFALSYTWGDTSRKDRILVGKTPFNVTKSLYVALLHLTPEKEPLTLWIDALCIDQDDEVEKTEQVQQMQQIYSQATSVITWLGPAGENSDAAMRWIQRYGPLAHGYGIGNRMELRLSSLLRTLEIDPEKLPHRERGMEEFLRDISAQLTSRACTSDSTVMALYKLFSRSYWSRVWVVQEMVHAKSVQFVCGNLAVSEDLLHHSLRLLRNFGQYERHKSAQAHDHLSLDSKLASTTLSVHKPINCLKIRRGKGPFPLIYLIRTLRWSQATDPRDRIFALLSFATDAEALGLYPDYQKSCKEVYVKTAASLVSHGVFDILACCEFNKSIPDLPSWVPDFNSKSRRVRLQQRALDRKAVPATTVLQPTFHASGGSQNIKVSFEYSGKLPTSLLLHAKFMAKVKRVGTAWEHQAFPRWLQDLMEFSGCDPTTAEPEKRKAVWRTAVADQESRQGTEKPRLTKHELEKVHNCLKDLGPGSMDNKTLVSLGLGDYVCQLQDVAHTRRPFCTSLGHIGIGPCEMVEGDLLYILMGAQVPYILRPSAAGKLELIGEAYAHGMMDGEAMEDRSPVEVITLC